MPSSEICFPKRRESMQYSVSAYPLKQLQGFTYTPRVRNLNKQMNMVWLYIKFINLKSILISYLSQYLFTKDSKLFKFERILSVFAFPHKVKCILSDSMPKIADFHFLAPAQSLRIQLTLT